MKNVKMFLILIVCLLGEVAFADVTFIQCQFATFVYGKPPTLYGYVDDSNDNLYFNQNSAFALNTRRAVHPTHHGDIVFKKVKDSKAKNKRGLDIWESKPYVDDANTFSFSVFKSDDHISDRSLFFATLHTSESFGNMELRCENRRKL